MTGAHLHLILNHLPVLGTFFAALTLAIALMKRIDSFQKIALLFFVALALAGILVAVAVYARLLGTEQLTG